MAEITQERLDEIYLECCQYRELNLLIRSKYDTRRSPSLQAHGKNTEPSDPTVKAFHTIDSYKERLQDHAEKIKEFIKDLQTVDDPEIRTIIIYRYLLGLSWKDVSKRLTGKPDKRHAMKKIIYYLEKNSSEK